MKKIILALLCSISLQSFAMDSEEFFRCNPANIASSIVATPAFTYFIYVLDKMRAEEDDAFTRGKLRILKLIAGSAVALGTYQLCTCTAQLFPSE